MAQPPNLSSLNASKDIAERTFRTIQDKAGALGVISSGARAFDELSASLKKLDAMPWGASFQAQLNQLRLSQAHLDAVRTSWQKLEENFDKKASKKTRTEGISRWKDGVLFHLGKVDAAAAATQAKLEKVQKAGLSVLGAGSMPELAGKIIKNTFVADATEKSAELALVSSGLNKDQIEKLKAQARTHGPKYGVSIASVLKLQAEAMQNLPAKTGENGTHPFDAVMGLGESFVQYRTSMGHILGASKGDELTNAVFKAVGAAGTNHPEDIKSALDSAVKMSRVFGQHVPIEQLLLAAKHARDGGKAINSDFFSSLAPGIQADRLNQPENKAIREAFGSIANEKPSEGARKALEKYGLLDESGKILGRELMANPGLWIESIGKAKFAKAGGDPSDVKSFSAFLSQITDGKISAKQGEAYIRQISGDKSSKERVEKADGLSAAEGIRHKDPSAALNSVMSALQNLAAAALSSETIAAHLSKIANAINWFADAISAGGPTTQNAITYGLYGYLLLRTLLKGRSVLPLLGALGGAALAGAGAGAGGAGGLSSTARFLPLMRLAARFMGPIGWGLLAYDVANWAMENSEDFGRNLNKRYYFRTPEERAQKSAEADELRKKIADTYAKSKNRDMADTITAPWKSQLQDLENRLSASERGEGDLVPDDGSKNLNIFNDISKKIIDIGEQIKVAFNVSPNIDHSGIDALISKFQHAITLKSQLEGATPPLQPSNFPTGTQFPDTGIYA